MGLKYGSPNTVGARKCRSGEHAENKRVCYGREWTERASFASCVWDMHEAAFLRQSSRMQISPLTSTYRSVYGGSLSV